MLYILTQTHRPWTRSRKVFGDHGFEVNEDFLVHRELDSINISMYLMSDPNSLLRHYFTYGSHHQGPVSRVVPCLTPV
jgi:hypothetical protein